MFTDITFSAREVCDDNYPYSTNIPLLNLFPSLYLNVLFILGGVAVYFGILFHFDFLNVLLENSYLWPFLLVVSHR